MPPKGEESLVLQLAKLRTDVLDQLNTFEFSRFLQNAAILDEARRRRRYLAQTDGASVVTGVDLQRSSGI
jgi:hypothetical protein